MNAIESQEIMSETTEQYGDNMKLVPVTESIRYRRRAQSAERQVEDLSEQLAQAKSQATKMSEQVNEIRLERNLMRKLAAAGAVDLEAAVLIAKTRLDGGNNTNTDSVIEQLKKEKQYLFTPGKETIAAKKTSGVKDRVQNSQTVLEKAAKKAATTGSRTDLQQYLKLRRNYV